MGSLRIVSLASLLLLLATGCAPSEPAAASPGATAVEITPAMISQGRSVFTSAGRCSVCHGQTGRGGELGPDLTDSEWIWIEPGANLHAQLVQIIRNGVPDPRVYDSPMPPMGGATLTEEQIQAAAAYVQSLSS